AATEAPTAEEAPKSRRTRARKTPEPAAEEGTGAATHAASTTSETSEEAPKPRRARARKAASERVESGPKMHGTPVRRKFHRVAAQIL
ncbi:hypothetical protein, partial [Adlercreutzia sp. DFI.6.23]|uniref:hypothetical protein n=1 Tax=Adlercreutzia sp. DFI.6.23 TaxID=2963705 RepID=UPI00210B7A6C